MTDTQRVADSPWLTPKQAAERASCGVRLLYREIRENRLRAARIGLRRDIRIHVTWLDDWLQACAEPVEVRPVRLSREREVAARNGRESAAPVGAYATTAASAGFQK